MRRDRRPDGGRFDAAEVVDRYRDQSGLTPAEAVLVEKWAPAPTAILDLGVGAGRTVAELESRCTTYLGIDIAPSMVDAARTSHPDSDIRVGDAASLTEVGDGTFDLVLWSYNGLDYLSETERAASLSECRRALTPDGILIVSSHDPRGILVAPTGLDGAVPRRLALAALLTLRRAGRALSSAALWTGRGWLREPQWDGGLRTYAVTPRRMHHDLAAAGFRPVDRISGEHPGPSRAGTSPWWYYVATAAPGGTPSSR